MNILITGGSGFIGSAVKKELLAADHQPWTYDLHDGHDIQNRNDVVKSLRGMDVVIHLAGVLGTDELFDNPYDAIDINITGTLNVLEGCVEHGAKYIGITMLPVFPSIYTASKVAAGRFATAYNHTHGVPVTHVRAFNVFGPGQAHGSGHPRKIIPAFSVEGWQKKPMIIWGDGEQMVDLIHVNDVARIFVEALNAPGKDEIIDAGTGVGLTVNQVAMLVSDYTDSRYVPFDYRPMRRGETPTMVVSDRTGWEHLSFQPKFDELDLMKTVVSYRELAEKTK